MFASGDRSGRQWTDEAMALVLAGGAGSRLGRLTAGQTKAAVPFGGRYRVIDFTLSNCVNSKLRRIAVLTQYKSQSLIRHVHSGWGSCTARSTSTSRFGPRSNATASVGTAVPST